MAGTVSRSTGALHRRAFAHILHMAAKWPLINGPIVVSRKRHAGMFQFVHCCRCLAHHILNRVLIAQPIRSLYGIVHVPRPMVRRVVLQRCRNATLCRHSVRTRGKNFRDTCGFQSGLGSAHRRAQTGTARADDNNVVSMVDNLVGIRHQAGAPVKACLATMKMPNAAAPMT